MARGEVSPSPSHMKRGRKPYHLVAANDGRETGLADALGPRVKDGPVRLGARVAEYNEAVLVRVQVVDADIVSGDDVLDGGSGDGRARTIAAAVVLRATLGAVTVNVHVGELARALEIDDAVVVKVVAAVRHVCEFSLPCQLPFRPMYRVGG
jgi:hypothetical protein